MRLANATCGSFSSWIAFASQHGGWPKGVATSDARGVRPHTTPRAIPPSTTTRTTAEDLSIDARTESSTARSGCFALPEAVAQTVRGDHEEDAIRRVPVLVD